MQTNLAHLQINVRAENLPFYKDLMSFLGWQPIYESNEPPMIGVGSDGGPSLWFVGAMKSIDNDYDGPGMNHLGIGARSQADVDATVAYLRDRGVAPLFETPRHRPEFASSEAETYYQVMFATPDQLLVEVVYTGPKSA